MRLTYQQVEDLKAVLGYAFKHDYNNIIINPNYISHNNIYKIVFECKKITNLDKLLYEHNKFKDNFKYALIIDIINHTFKISLRTFEDVDQISLFDDENTDKTGYRDVITKHINTISLELNNVGALLFDIFLDKSNSTCWTFYFKGGNGVLYFANQNGDRSIKVSSNCIEANNIELDVYKKCFKFNGTKTDSRCMALRRTSISNIKSNRYNIWKTCKLYTPLKQLV